MRARKIGLLLIIAAVIGSTIFSSFHAANAFGSINTNGTPSNLGKPGSNSSPRVQDSAGAVVLRHKITATELQAIRNKVGVSVEGYAYNELVDGHGTGLRAPTASEWQEISQTGQIVGSVTYPSSPLSVDNSVLPWFPPIGNQGTEGSCVAWSVGYYVKTFQEAKEHGW